MIVLFAIESGLKIQEFSDESRARAAMRAANTDAGFRRLGQSWIDGIECEWAETVNGAQCYSPYAITEYRRWEQRYRPEMVIQRNQYGAEDTTQEMV